MSKKTNKVRETEYRATLNVLGKTYESFGTTIAEAIGGLNVSNCKGRAILTLDNGTIKKERIFMPTIISRLFNSSGLTREVALKNISSTFQGL